MSLFLAAFQIVVGIEGGYVDRPDDPGGATKFGISQRAYPALDIKNLTLDQAQAIYLKDYWDACGCELMPWERALCVFDCAVNEGQGTARSLNVKSHDVIEFLAERALRYTQSKEFETFGRGWFRRLFSIMKSAQVTPQ